MNVSTEDALPLHLLEPSEDDEPSLDELRLAYRVATRSRSLEEHLVRAVSRGEVPFAIWGPGEEVHGVATAMALRLVVLVIFAGLLARNIDAEALLLAGERLGLERLGLTLGLALNVLPQLMESTRQVLVAWRVRRRF